MKTTYVYLYHDGFSFYLSDDELSPEERYCNHCDAADELFRVCHSDEELYDTVALLSNSYDMIERETHEEDEE